MEARDAKDVRLALSNIRRSLEEASELQPLDEDREAAPRLHELSGMRVSIAQYQDDHRSSLDKLLTERCSERRFAGIRVDSLGKLLWRVGRVLSWSGSSRQRIHRPAPTAGGRASTEFAVAAFDVTGLAPGWWWFDALRGAFVLDEGRDLDALPLKLSEVLQDAAPPPAAVFVVAHPQRLVTRYPRGSSLLWREAGVALSLLHLAAFDLGLASCILGSAGLVLRDDAAWDVGCLAVGDRCR